MKKLTFLFFFIFIICGCEENHKVIDFKKSLNGKTFNIANSIIDQDIEFYDSTVITYTLKLFENKYHIEKINDSTSKIFFGNEPAQIKSSSSNDYDFIIIGEKLKDTIILKETGVLYNKQDIIGYWEETPNQYYKINNQSITKELNDSIVERSKLRFDASNKYLNFTLPQSSDRTESLWKILKIKNDTLFIDKGFKTKDGWTTFNNIKLIKKR
ncbi:hypothetical protein ACU8DI_13150 [Psychroserpens sp. BH13MA-6]